MNSDGYNIPLMLNKTFFFAVDTRDGEVQYLFRLAILDKLVLCKRCYWSALFFIALGKPQRYIR